MAGHSRPDDFASVLRIPAEDVIRRPVDRRTFLAWSARSSLAGLTLVGAFGGVVAACGDNGGNGDGGGDARGGGGGNLPPSLKVGVIVPTSGIGQFLGEIVQRSMAATKQHIESEGLLPGTTVDYKVVNAPVEQFTQATSKAYNELVGDPDVIGILWCTPFGLAEAKPQIQRDGIPVIAVYADPYSDGVLYPAGGGARNVFQMLLPDAMSFDALCAYAADDRKYSSVALMYDSVSLTKARNQFEPIAASHGLDVVAVEEFSLVSADYGAQLQRLKQAKPQSLIVWGLADNTANIAKGLDALGAGYVDTPTAKSDTTWAPHILGYPGGTGEKTWAELAGSAAKAGTLTAWYLGGLVGGPHFPIRDWLVAYDGRGASGGEEGASNAWWALIEGVKKAGTKDRAKVVAALEQIPKIEFAGLPFHFGTDNHLGMTRDDVVLITLERYTGPVETDPPYVAGKEWETTFPLIKKDYVGPGHLVRPTLEANKRAQPEYMEQILTEGWGVQCTKRPPEALGTDVPMTNDCKIH
jgi:ABC-type branched-subunit amino acid transport system substrate-binding protein